jgi:hypothetical protein
MKIMLLAAMAYQAFAILVALTVPFEVNKPGLQGLNVIDLLFLGFTYCIAVACGVVAAAVKKNIPLAVIQVTVAIGIAVLAYYRATSG